MSTRHLVLALPLLLLAGPGAAQCDEVELFTSVFTAGSFGGSSSASGDTVVVGAPGALGFGAACVFRREQSADWSELAVLLAWDGALGDAFGHAVAISDDTIVVTAPDASPLGQWSGAAYVFRRHGDVWVEDAKLVPSLGQPQAAFGRAVAVSGSRVLVGEVGFASVSVGRAYVFERDSFGSWNEVAVLGGVALSQFGSSVALSGGTAVVGAPLAFDGTGGAVYVYTEVGGTFVHEATIQQVDIPTSSGFGTSVAVDGDTAAIGAKWNYWGAPHPGAVYAYRRTAPGSWSLEAKLTGSGFASPGQLGNAVALAGERVAAGAWVTSTPWAAATGAVYVFERVAGAWTQTDLLIHAASAVDDNIGWAVALFDGGVLGTAPYDGPSGRVHAFELAEPAALVGCPMHLSLSAGGMQRFDLAAGAEHSNKLFLLVGSTRGTSPGLAIDGLVLPLNPDDYLLFTLSNPSQPPLVSSLGILDSAGTSTSAFVLPPATDPSLAGLTLHHAAIVVPLPAFAPVQFVTNAASVVLKP